MHVKRCSIFWKKTNQIIWKLIHSSQITFNTNKNLLNPISHDMQCHIKHKFMPMSQCPVIYFPIANSFHTLESCSQCRSHITINKAMYQFAHKHMRLYIDNIYIFHHMIHIHLQYHLMHIPISQSLQIPCLHYNSQ